MGRVWTLLRGCLTAGWVLRELLLVVALGIWLGGYFLSDGWEQRRAFLWLVPLLVLNGDLLVKTVRETRWLWAVALLLVYQALSRLWSHGGGEPVATVVDAATVLVLTTALVLIGQRESLRCGMVAWLGLLAVFVTLASLLVFYGADEYHLATDRLRNVFIYPDVEPRPGLNPVLTGMLCAFGAVAMAWFAGRADWRLQRWTVLTFLSILVFGVMASQSRGAMLAGFAGMAVLVFFLGRAMWPALVATVGSAAVYLIAVLRSDTAADLIERGSSGRLEIYHWFLDRVTGVDILVGRGMASAVSIPEEELGWFVDHPHSAYLTQYLLTGVVGLALLAVVIGWAGGRSVREAYRGEAMGMALLASGAVAVLFDCAQIFSLHSAPRIEYLLVVVPAALVIGKGGEQ